MKRLVLILTIILSTSIIFTGFIYSSSDLSSKIIEELKAKSEIESIFNEAADYFTKKYPEFEADRNQSYISVDKKTNNWYVYLFDNRDKGLGYEVFNENGVITDNFNKDLFSKRLELIEYMNKLMPGNKQYNEYVGFNPFGSNQAKSYNSAGVYDGRVEYAVVAKKIDIKKQVGIDYLILKKANELLKDLMQPGNGIWVKYYETNEPDISVYKEKNVSANEYIKGKNERSSWTTVFLNETGGLKLIAEYKLGEWESDKAKADKTRTEILTSLENYKSGLKAVINASIKSQKEKNALLLDALLTAKEKQEIEDKKKQTSTGTGSSTSGNYALKIKKEGNFSEVKFSPNGKQIACVTEYGSKILIIDSQTGRKIRELKSTQIGALDLISSIGYSPDGKHIAGANYNNNIEIWEASTGKLVKTLMGHMSKVRVICFSPDGKYISSASEDCKLRIWSTETWKTIKTVGQNQQYTLIYSPDGKYIISGNQVLDAKTGKMVKEFSKVEGIRCFSPDGKYVAACSIIDKDIKIINFETGELLKTLKGHTKVIKDVSFSPDGKHLASASSDETVKIWGVETGKEIGALEEVGSGSALSVEYSPDGKKLAIGWFSKMACYNVQ